MLPLEKSLRNNLEKTVKEARDIAEEAARVALEQLGVGESKAYPHLSDDDRKLRRKLRTHGRQLGNGRNAKGEQGIDRLIEEVAYEHWHRMLFARFLAENDLLMFSESTKDTKSTNENKKAFSSISGDPWTDAVPVTLEECEDLAADEGAANGWELAARFAARMLPQIFRLDSPVFQLVLPPEHQQKLERLVADLPPEVFTASDSIGWVYQFWQAKRKDEVNASEVKIGARELPAVTQLFTESYMVSFLLDNSLGAWWAERRLSTQDIEEVSTKYTNKTKKIEEELRKKASIPGVPLEYLRFVKQEDVHKKYEPHEKEEKNRSCLSCGSWTKNSWSPAAGTFDGWPEQISDLKILDPCCGSGHFLVAAFLMLVPMRMVLEGLSAKGAVDAVLRENIHGLELDQRCVELAAFALALAAWKYPGAGGYRPLPELNIACSGLSVSVAREEWKAMAKSLPDKSYLPIALDWMYEAFKDAPTLGSLLDPARARVAGLVQWEKIGSAIKQVLAKDQPDAVMEAGVVAHGLAKAIHLLTENYNWIITNVPYLTRGKQADKLKNFCAKYYKEAKNDLATVFLDRCLELCAKSGTASMVMPQNWLFLTSYKKFREKLLKKETWHLIARLGPGAFETISGEVVKAVLVSMSRAGVSRSTQLWSRDNNPDQKGPATLIRGVDVSKPRATVEKAAGLMTAEIKSVEQEKQLGNPDARIAFDSFESMDLISTYADSYLGLGTGDFDKFGRRFWEFGIKLAGWGWLQSSAQGKRDFDGLSLLVAWDSEINRVRGMDKRHRERIHNQDQSGQQAWNKRGISISLMRGLRGTVYIGCQYDKAVAVLIPKNKSNLDAIYAYSSSLEYHDRVREVDQNIIVASGTLVKVPFDLPYWTKIAQQKYPHGLPAPYSDDPTQWIFHGHPCGSVVWDEDKKWTTHGPMGSDATVLQVAVARLLGYRWPAELDVTMELADEQREWVNRCEALLSYADDDGIVCIPPVRGEASATDRLMNLLAKAHSQCAPLSSVSCISWTEKLLANTDHAGKTLEAWLREKFFTQHCKLFHHRPFIWHIWDGLNDGFSALVNYHKLDAKLLETLIYTYLGDWITRQKQDISNGVDGAQEKLAAAEALKKKLELILEGEAPYDIFVRWKPIEKQPIGWNPDLNDGVRLNIRPFMTVGDVKKKGAGVLRDKPNIKWTKDRGKDVASAPWYSVFGGDRINDHHLTIAEKQNARGR